MNGETATHPKHRVELCAGLTEGHFHHEHHLVSIRHFFDVFGVRTITR